MIRHDDPYAHPPTDLLSTPGAFLWWYAELLDERGSGAVLIWSYGLPFLPGLQSAARNGHPGCPGDRPSINLVLYDQGVPTFYILQELSPERVGWDGAFHWTFGSTDIRVTDGPRGRELDVRLQLEPSTAPEVSGRMRISGTVPKVGAEARDLAGDCDDHAWTPLALPAFGTLDVSYGTDERLFVAGRAYFDRNWSRRPLDQLGFDRWLWGHQANPENERVFYCLWEEGSSAPHVIGLEYRSDGGMTIERDLTLATEQAGKTLFGMPNLESVELRSGGEDWLSFDLGHRVDDGPFYLRYLTTDAEHDRVLGSAEVISPERIDLARHRPLVRMRVDDEINGNSIWLPLFEGSTTGRVHRLLEHWGRALRPTRQPEATL